MQPRREFRALAGDHLPLAGSAAGGGFMAESRESSFPTSSCPRHPVPVCGPGISRPVHIHKDTSDHSVLNRHQNKGMRKGGEASRGASCRECDTRQTPVPSNFNNLQKRPNSRSKLVGFAVSFPRLLLDHLHVEVRASATTFYAQKKTAPRG